MLITTTAHLPLPIERLWMLARDPRYVEQKYLALGAETVSLRRFVTTPQRIESELQRDMPVPAAQVPAWLERWIGSRQTLRQRSTWRRLAPARIVTELELEAVGLPVRLAARACLDESRPGGVRVRAEWRVTSSLAELGGPIERLCATAIEHELGASRGFTLCYAADPRLARPPSQEPLVTYC